MRGIWSQSGQEVQQQWSEIIRWMTFTADGLKYSFPVGAPLPSRQSCWLSPPPEGINELLACHVPQQRLTRLLSLHTCILAAPGGGIWGRGLIWSTHATLARQHTPKQQMEGCSDMHHSHPVIWLGIWLRGGGWVIVHLCEKISRMIKGDRAESLLLLISHWPGWKRNLLPAFVSWLSPLPICLIQIKTQNKQTPDRTSLLLQKSSWASEIAAETQVCLDAVRTNAQRNPP